jgi:hypothetical protein
MTAWSPVAEFSGGKIHACKLTEVPRTRVLLLYVLLHSLNVSVKSVFLLQIRELLDSNNRPWDQHNSCCSSVALPQIKIYCLLERDWIYLFTDD